MIYKIVRDFVNALTAGDKHYLLNGEILTQPIQMQLSQKQKTFSGFFFFFLSFFSFLKLFTIQKIKLKFTNKRKIKIKKTKICHPIFPSLRLMKNNSLLLPPAPSYTPCLLPRLKTNLTPSSHLPAPESDKMSKSFGLQNIFN